MNWDQLKKLAAKNYLALKLSQEYFDRLKFEIKEIEKQGTNEYWVTNYIAGKKWDINPGGLVVPFLLGMTEVDPIKAGIKHKVEYQTDFPDIDLDFLPHAREYVKQYAIDKYHHVCSVGSWVTFKPKLALQNAAGAIGGIEYKKSVIKMTTQLPDEFDDLDWEDHEELFKKAKSDNEVEKNEALDELRKYQIFYDFRKAEERNQRLVEIAYKLVGKIVTQGTHAAGIIVADRPIEDIVPLSLMKGKSEEGTWTSQWTEGARATQLSKFGLVKFDLLGLKTVYYIWQACNLIRQTRGVEFDWDDMDPLASPPRAGWEIAKDGTRKLISFEDVESLKACNELRTDSIFQIESQIQKGIIRDGGVKSFGDLVVYNALGRPGPIEEIPEYIKRRDDKEMKWKDGMDPRIVEVLKSTYGIICYQEQLQTMWIRLAGFNVPEAEAARKVIAKKWQDKLPQVEKKWKDGAEKVIGKEEADRWWELMKSFGRYAFNLAHSIAYSIVTYRSLYLKTHYHTHWWSAVMTGCHREKLPNYIRAARSDNVQFKSLDILNLSEASTVVDDMLVPGLIFVKGIGKKAAAELEKIHIKDPDIDKVVESFGRQKTTFERLIKLGAFDAHYPNRKALWNYYLCKYGSKQHNKEVVDLVNEKYKWPDEKIAAERRLREQDYRNRYPKRKKIPAAITNWKPKIEPTREEIMSLFTDYTNSEKLEIEKEFYGHYWTNPITLFDAKYPIDRSKPYSTMDVVIEEVHRRISKKQNVYYVFRVTDGKSCADVIVWQNVFRNSDKETVQPGRGIRMTVECETGNFAITGDDPIRPLRRVTERDGMW